MPLHNSDTDTAISFGTAAPTGAPPFNGKLVARIDGATQRLFVANGTTGVENWIELGRKSLTELTDFAANVTPQDNWFLKYSVSTSKWTPFNPVLASLSDVSTTLPTTGEALVWDGNLAKWKPGTVAAANQSVEMADIVDVDLSPMATNGQVLGYNSTSQKWEPTTAIGTIAQAADYNNAVGKSNGDMMKWNSTTSKWTPSAPYGLDDLTGVDLGSFGNNAILSYNSATQVWRAVDGGAFTIQGGSISGTDIVLPSAPGSPVAGSLYRTGDNVLYRDSTNTARTLLSGADNLASLTNAATARQNLGLNSNFGGTLASLGDVNISSPSDGHVLTWNTATSKWVAAAGGGGGGGATNLDGLSDVIVSNPLNGQTLRHNGSNFVNAKIYMGDLADINFGTLNNGDLLKWNSSSQQWYGAAPAAVEGFTTATLPIDDENYLYFANQTDSAWNVLTPQEGRMVIQANAITTANGSSNEPAPQSINLQTYTGLASQTVSAYSGVAIGNQLTIKAGAGKSVLIGEANVAEDNGWLSGATGTAYAFGHDNVVHGKNTSNGVPRYSFAFGRNNLNYGGVSLGEYNTCHRESVALGYYADTQGYQGVIAENTSSYATCQRLRYTLFSNGDALMYGADGNDDAIYNLDFGFNAVGNVRRIGGSGTINKLYWIRGRVLLLGVNNPKFKIWDIECIFRRTGAVANSTIIRDVVTDIANSGSPMNSVNVKFENNSAWNNVTSTGIIEPRVIISSLSSSDTFRVRGEVTCSISSL